VKKFLTPKVKQVIIEEEKNLESEKVLDSLSKIGYNRGRKELKE
jgi:hypothetical protein